MAQTTSFPQDFFTKRPKIFKVRNKDGSFRFSLERGQPLLQMDAGTEAEETDGIRAETFNRPRCRLIGCPFVRFFIPPELEATILDFDAHCKAAFFEAAEGTVWAHAAYTPLYDPETKSLDIFIACLEKGGPQCFEEKDDGSIVSCSSLLLKDLCEPLLLASKLSFVRSELMGERPLVVFGLFATTIVNLRQTW